jgi:DNA-binding NarL/FixJ family response regulator
MSFFKKFIGGNNATRLHIVDDSKIFLVGLKKQLSEVLGSDVEVQIHLDSQSLINAVQNNSNEVIIMDFHLDEDSTIDGIELLQVLRKKFDKVPVLVLTGNQDVDIAKQCFKHGASNYIVKNVSNISATIDEIKYKLGLIKLI